MRWPVSRRKDAKHAQPRDAVIMAVTQALTRQTAQELAREVERVDRDAPVVIDLTAIPGFDSDGAEALLALQAARGADRLSIVGLRQATARLVGPDDPAPLTITPPSSGWALRRLRNLVVVQPLEATAPTAAGLSDAVATASTDTTAAIIVVDLRGLTSLPADVVESIAFASSAAALRGQELLVVNVDIEVAETLRIAGLSATTYVAPEPPLDPLSN
jgi:anti-anti-sigma regulatory factor